MDMRKALAPTNGAGSGASEQCASDITDPHVSDAVGVCHTTRQPLWFIQIE